MNSFVCINVQFMCNLCGMVSAICICCLTHCIIMFVPYYCLSRISDYLVNALVSFKKNSNKYYIIYHRRLQCITA